MNDAAGARLIRGLRRGDLVALVINTVVGAGIFGLPSQVYALAGTYSLAANIVLGPQTVGTQLVPAVGSPQQGRRPGLVGRCS